VKVFAADMEHRMTGSDRIGAIGARTESNRRRESEANKAGMV
jgi:hypothetical protein